MFRSKCALIMKISIVVPVFNAQRYVADCFNSIAGQTYRDMEVIFVDDASTDESIQVLRSLINEAGVGIDYSIALHDNNMNVSTARNTGMGKATGDYLMFVDSDDVITPVAVELLAKLARDYQYADIIRGGYLDIDMETWDYFSSHGWGFIENFIKKNRKREGFEVLDGDNVFKFWLENFDMYGNIATMSACMTLYRMDFIRKNNLRFTADLRQAEDVYFNYLCFKLANQVVLEHTPAYFYRRHDGSISKDRYHYYKGWTGCLEKVSNDLQNEKQRELIVKWCSNYIGLMILSLKSGKEKTLIRRFAGVLEKIKPFINADSAL